jgi:secondary thiamine-phosphate synthase enzyme
VRKQDLEIGAAAIAGKASNASAVPLGDCSTAAIGAIEFEPGLEQDLPALLRQLIPPGRNYAHEQAWHDGNGHSHLQATLLGPSLTVPVRGGKLVLGTWQQIFHIECDVRPRERVVMVTVLGE